MTTAPLVTSRNPARPGDIVGETSLSTDHEIELHLATASQAVNGWAQDGPARAQALDAWADNVRACSEELALLACREVGKPIKEARAEVDRAIAILRYYAQAAFDPMSHGIPSTGGEISVRRRPLGLVLAIAPWNFPIAIPVWKAAPALAWGNTVLVKPSSSSLLTTMRVLECARDVFPGGVVSALPTTARQAARLIDDQRVAAVSFTGSEPVGRGVVLACARLLKPVQAEMGGHNPVIVLEDADLDRAAQLVAAGAMAYAGQKCTATRRVIVHRDIASEFTDRLVAACEVLPFGDPSLPETVVGPLISNVALDAMESAVARSVAEGGHLLLPGMRSTDEGWFHEPVVVRDVPTSTLATEETFAPALVVLQADGVDQAVRIANSTRYGLVGAVFTRDRARVVSAIDRLDVGLLRWNAPTTGVDFQAPFGGNKASGYGPREQGRDARMFFTRSQTTFATW